MARLSGCFNKRLSFGLLMGLALAAGSVGSATAFDTASTTARVYGIYRESTAANSHGTTGLGFINALSTNPTANALLTSDGRPNGTYAGAFKGAIPSGGQVVYFFCANIAKPIDPMPVNYNPVAVLSPLTRTKIAYLIATNYGAWYPTTANGTPGSNALYAEVDAAAALQLAIWHYTDGLSVNNIYFKWSGYNGVSSTKVRNLAKAYVASADANWNSYHVVDRLLFVPQTQTVTVGQPSSFQVQAFDTAGNPMSGVLVSLTSSAGTLSASSATTGAGGLTPTITLTGASPAEADLNASATRSSQIAGITYARATNPGSYQYVVLATKNSDAINDPNGSVTITPTGPTITTNASSGVMVGSPIHDSATLAGATANATGTITFKLYGPGDATCTLSALATSTANVLLGNATYISDDFSPSAPGTYHWIANYGGDANNSATANGCGGTTESVVVSPTSPTLDTTASGGVVVGSPIHDSATLAGATANATGIITFKLYGPGDTTCALAALATSTADVSGNGPYLSGTFTPSAPGTYRWIANYGGDVNNSATANGCGGTTESVVVSSTPPTPKSGMKFEDLNADGVKDQGEPGLPGWTIYVDYNNDGVFDPAAEPSAVTDDDGNYELAGVIPGGSWPVREVAQAGWTCSFPILSDAHGCYYSKSFIGDQPTGMDFGNWRLTSPTLDTTASAGVVVGNPIHDSALLAGATANASGTITFKLYGPDDNTCATPIAAYNNGTGISTVPVAGNDTYLSAPFTPSAAGTYHWIANYSGDANNNGTANGCNGTNESVVVSPTSTATSTPTVSPSHLPSPSAMPNTSTGAEGSNGGATPLLLLGLILLFGAGSLFAARRWDLPHR